MQASMLEIYNESLRDLLSPASAQKVSLSFKDKLYGTCFSRLLIFKVSSPDFPKSGYLR